MDEHATGGTTDDRDRSDGDPDDWNGVVGDLDVLAWVPAVLLALSGALVAVAGLIVAFGYGVEPFLTLGRLLAVAGILPILAAGLAAWTDGRGRGFLFPGVLVAGIAGLGVAAAMLPLELSLTEILFRLEIESVDGVDVGLAIEGFSEGFPTSLRSGLTGAVVASVLATLLAMNVDTYRRGGGLVAGGADGSGPSLGRTGLLLAPTLAVTVVAVVAGLLAPGYLLVWLGSFAAGVGGIVAAFAYADTGSVRVAVGAGLLGLAPALGPAAVVLGRPVYGAVLAGVLVIAGGLAARPALRGRLLGGSDAGDGEAADS